MENKFLVKIIFVFLCCILCINSGYAQQRDGSSKKLVYTIQVDGLLDHDQVTRLNHSLKQKTGIISSEINFETKTVVLETIKDVTYSNVCDILSVEKLKAQNYVVKEK